MVLLMESLLQIDEPDLFKTWLCLAATRSKYTFTYSKINKIKSTKKINKNVVQKK